MIVCKSIMLSDPAAGTIEKTWPAVNRMLRHRCPDILDLFDALLTIPASTADCERGFSVLKQVKSDWRSRLKGESLSDLLKTQLCSPDIKDFDPTKAISIWHADSLHRRKPEFVRKNITKETSDSEEEIQRALKIFEVFPSNLEMMKMYS